MGDDTDDRPSDVLHPRKWLSITPLSYVHVLRLPDHVPYRLDQSPGHKAHGLPKYNINNNGDASSRDPAPVHARRSL